MKKLYFVSAIFISFCFSAFGQLNVTPGVAPATLVGNLVGTGVTFSNVTTNGATPSSIGSFTCTGTCNIGFPNGILLTSGSAAVAAAPNTGTGQGAVINNLSDPQLTTLTTGITRDASTLEFDFWVASDSVSFLYVFASDEYSDYVNSQFNDVFGFFINGPTIPVPTNLALIPGTGTSVAINNLNNGYAPGPPTPPSGPCNNCAYFRDNTVPVSYTTAYDGLTTPLTAATTVCPCETYHIKLAISDVGDQVFDSGVFLEGNSFSSVGQINIFANGVPQPNTATVYVCDGQSVTLSVLSNLNCSVNYTWATGATTQSIVVNQANVGTGIFAATVTHPTNPTCFVFTTFINVVFVTPTASISGINSICAGGNTTLTANPGSAYLWSTGATTQTINVSSAGVYTVTVTSVNGGCTATSVPFAVTVGGAVATISGVTSLCNGAATTLTANLGTGYLWSSGETTQAINVTASGTYTVTVTQAGGCTASISANVTVNPNPVPNITGVTSVCQGNFASLNAGPGYSSYLWSTNATTQNVNIPIAGTYTATVTDANGCTGTDNIVVNINPLPVPVITGNPAFCQGGNSVLDAGAGYSNYLWSNSATTQTINVLTAGLYQVTVTNGFGCTGVASLNVAVNPLPVPVIAGTTAFCQGSNTTLDAGAGYANYLWSNSANTQTINVTTSGTFTVTVTDANGCTGTTSISTIVNPNPLPVIAGVTSICQGDVTTFDAGVGYSNYLWSTTAVTQTISPSASGTYTVTVTDANGCTGTDDITLVVNALPTPAISGTTTFCQGGNSTLNAGAGYTTYLWSTSANTQTINVTASGNYTVTVTDGNGCTANTSVNIVVNANPAPSIAGITSFCLGNNTSLDAGAGYSSYLWSNSSNTQTINVASAGTFTVTVTNVNGCTGTASTTTVVNPLPSPNITGVTSVCQGVATLFDAGSGYSTYVWSTGAGSQTISPTIAGTYTVTVTDINGCTGSDNINLVVNPLPTPAISGITAFCQGGNSTLNAGGGYSSYLWSTSANTQTINVTTGGNYIVTVTNGFGCSGSTSVNITANPNPVPIITGATAFCQGSNTTLNAGAGYTNYLWSNSANTQTINVAITGTFTVTVTDANGCTGTVSIATIVNPNPVPAITGVTTICQGATTAFNAGTYSSYLWSTGALTQNITAGIAGNYTVTVTDANGCTGTDDITLVVNPLPTPAISGITAFCQGGNSTLNAGGGYSSYLWSTSANTQTINVATGGNYIVTVTNGFGCSGSTSINIVVNPLPNPFIAGGTSICTGGATTLNAGNGYANYSWSTGATTQTIIVNVAGNYSVIVTDNNGCSNSASTTMVINPLPTPAITGVTAICQGTTTSFNAGTYSSFIWSTGATTQTITPGTAGIYIVTVTDANGCTGSDNINLVVNPLPTPSIAGNTVFCQGDNTTLNAGAGYTLYTWSTGATTQTINTGAAGNYSVIVQDGNGCTASTSVVIVVNPLPTPVITGINAICQGTTSTLNGGNYASFVWSTGATTQTIVTGNAGSYTVTVTDNNGCVNSSNAFNLTVYVLPSATLSQNSAICIGASSTFNISFTGTAPFTYTYASSTGPNVTATTSSNPVAVNVTPIATTVYSMISVTDAHCTGSVSGSTATVTVNPLPTPSIAGNTVFCQGDNTTLNAGTGYTSYTWSTGATTQTINTGAAGNYSVIVEDGNGCTASTAVTIVVNPLPTPVITGTNAICQNATSTLYGGNYASYVWSTGATTPAIITGTAGNYTVTVTDVNGCVGSSAPFALTVYNLPSAAISQNSSICIGASSNFNISFTGTAPFTYTYASTTGPNVTATTSSNSVVVNVTPNATTTYSMVSITDAHCAGNVTVDSATVTVNPLPTPAITGISTICDGTTTTFDAGPGYINYLWSTGANTQTILVNNAGSYKVTVTDNNGCVNSDSQTLTVNQTPVVNFTNDTSLTCETPIIHFTNVSSYPTGSTFAWDFGDGAVSSLENPSHIYANPGTYPILLTITSQQNCVGSVLQNVDVQFYPLPVAQFKADPSPASVFNSLVNLTDLSQNAITWSWNFGDGKSSTEQSPEHYYDEIGKFHIILTVTSIAGCVSRYEQEVLITPFFVPNGFTPNGDGMNDEFFNAGYTMDVSAFNMTIWNRWGQKVYENDNYNKPWNGADMNGNVSPQGTYVYQIKVMTKNQKEYSYDGTVTLIR